VVVNNTWARHLCSSSNGGGGSSGAGTEQSHSAASVAAAAAAQRHYRQLHEDALHQATLNQQLKGTFALKAYKGE
jgi:hypothetical protein